MADWRDDVLKKDDVEYFKRDLVIIMVLMGYSTIFLIGSVGFVWQRMKKITRWSGLSVKEFERACHQVSGQKYGQWKIEVRNGFIYIS